MCELYSISAPKRSQDAPRGSKRPPRGLQDGSMRHQTASQEASKLRSHPSCKPRSLQASTPTSHQASNPQSLRAPSVPAPSIEAPTASAGVAKRKQLSFTFNLTYSSCIFWLARTNIQRKGSTESAIKIYLYVCTDF